MIPLKNPENKQQSFNKFIKIFIYLFLASFVFISVAINIKFLIFKYNISNQNSNINSNKNNNIRSDIISNSINSNDDKNSKINDNNSNINSNNPINLDNKEILNLNKRCHYPIDNPNMRIVHLVLTRFLMDLHNKNKKEFLELIKTKEYILNGIRVMKKYLFYSLENQSCTNFISVILLGDQVDITYIKSLFNFKYSFEIKVIYEKDFQEYLKDITKNSDILITTRLDYDDQIYYDAVNDVRKAINVYKPLLIYGYNRGYFYFEIDDKYYENYSDYKTGAWALFLSLITVLNKVNGTYTIHDMGNHWFTKRYLSENYKSFGIKELNYEPAVIDTGDPKFIYVRQKYSNSYDEIKRTVRQNRYKECSVNLSYFYGK
jgi:hypothetical protein